MNNGLGLPTSSPLKEVHTVVVKVLSVVSLAVMLLLLLIAYPTAARADCADLRDDTHQAIEGIKNFDAARAHLDMVSEGELEGYTTNITLEITKGAAEPCSDVKSNADYQLVAAWWLLNTVRVYAMMSPYGDDPDNSGLDATTNHSCQIIALTFGEKGLAQAWYGLWLTSKDDSSNEYLATVEALASKSAGVMQVSLPSYSIGSSAAADFLHSFDGNYGIMRDAVVKARSMGDRFSEPCFQYDLIPSPPFSA